MPNLGPLRGKTPKPPAVVPGHRCERCRQELNFVRRHVSPPRLGPAVTTEFYECCACDSAYALNTATGKWKPWVGDEG